MDRKAACALLVVFATAMLHEIEHNDDLVMLPSRYRPRCRRPSKRRERTRFESRTAYLSDTEFHRAFRLSRRAFDKLVVLLHPYLVRDEAQAKRSSGGAIEPAMRLGITLRMLSGGLHHDQMISWCIGRSTTYAVFKDTTCSINTVMSMPGVPLRDESKLQALANEFSSSRALPNPLYGCVAALDGIAITITKPPDEYVPRNFVCRKGFYELPVQAVVDARYRFLCMSCRCSGSTHDSVAFDVSELAEKLRVEGLRPGYWIAADPAY